MAPLQDSITLHTDERPQEDHNSRTLSERQRHILIYFIPGNPGLIEYYRLFLAHLRSTLAATNPNTSVTIQGNSLAGFHVNSPPRPGSRDSPLNLQQQIQDVETRLLASIASPKTTSVILMGHSVGAYIMMSLLSRRHASSSLTQDLDIAAAIGLFPTIVDLHASPNGRKAAWIAPIPGLSHLLQALSKLLRFFVSFKTVTSLVKRITKQPDPAARVTAAFLSSPGGVRQAIYLAQHELKEMREDKWDDNIWANTEKTTASPASAALFFYWGADDHWIANMTRDAVIARRAVKSDDGPRMEIDTQDTPHDFCVREKDTALVVEKVAGYVREIIDGRA